mgnify:CR=1|tara:strand:+ start:1123 stop:1320 length:198 start_codon:yes stop_codon:yes gene_type:complete
MAKPQYFVVQNDKKEGFEAAVEFNLRQGWKLVGGVFMQRVTTYEDGDRDERMYYCQAITKGGKSA